VRVLILRLSVAAACIAICSTALAQNVRSRERTFEASETLAADLRRARLHGGPFYLLSNIEFSDLGYENQFFFPTTEQGGGLSLAVAAPQKLYFVPARKTIYSLTVTPEYAFFQRGVNKAPWGYLVRGDAHYLLNHIYVNAYALQSNKLQALSGEINRVVTQREETAGLAGEIRYSSRTRALYAFSARRYSYPPSRYQPSDITTDIGTRGSLFDLDRREQNGRLSLLHHTFPLTSLTFAGEVNKYKFPTAAGSDSTRRYAAPGFVYDAGIATWKAEAGPAVLHFYTPSPAAGGGDFRGIVGNTQFSRRLGPKTQLTLAADRDVDFSILPGERYYVADRALFAIDRQATRRLTLRFSSTLGRDQYPALTINPVNVQLARRRDEFSFTSIGWRYTMRHVKGGFDIGYYQRRSNFDIDEQNGIRLAIALSLSP
jgi:hypothetical protein